MDSHDKIFFFCQSFFSDSFEMKIFKPAKKKSRCFSRELVDQIAERMLDDLDRFTARDVVTEHNHMLTFEVKYLSEQ